MTNLLKPVFIQLFERDHGRCIYCGLDLKADYDRFMMATEDHLVPKSKSTQCRSLESLVLSCAVCNHFKGCFVPEPPLDPVKERRAYISCCRAFIMEKRNKKMKEFIQVTHPNLLDYQ